MPNYDYECPQCAHRFELWQAVGAEPPQCEKCGATTKKVFQVPRIIFKGSGFYVTDKRSESGAAKKEGGESAGSESAAGESAPSESKSDAPGSGEKAAAKPESAPSAPAT